MKQADEIQALREEVAELRNVAPVVVPYAPQPLPVPWQPPISPNICSGRID